MTHDHAALLQTVQAIARQKRVAILLVGGAVRDMLLQRPAHDFDFAVLGNPVPLARAVADQLQAAFWLMDAERGTARVIVTEADASRVVLDFARVRGGSFEADLGDRDFTMNAMGLNLETQQRMDLFGGERDLAAKRVRAVTPMSISSDPVRALRAVRQAWQFGFRIEENTLAQVGVIQESIHQSSAERSRDELLAMCALPNAAPALRQLDQLRLLEQLIPEVKAMHGCTQSPPHLFDVWEHTLQVIAALDEMPAWRLETDGAIFSLQSLVTSPLVTNLQSATANTNRLALLKLAALLHDCAKPDTRTVDPDGRVRFFTHEERGAEKIGPRLHALKLSSDEMHAVRTVVRHHMRANQLARQGEPTLAQLPSARAVYRFMRDAGECAVELALFAIADCYGKTGDYKNCDPSKAMTALLLHRYQTQFAPNVRPSPLVTGRDVIALGVTAGPHIGQLLESIREAHLSGELATRDEALAMLRHLIQT